MSETKVTVKVRFEVICNKIKDFDTGIKFFSNILGDKYDLEEDWVDFYDPLYKPIWKNNKWYIDVELEDSYEYDFDFVTFDEDVFNDVRSELIDKFGYYDYHSPRLGISVWYNGVDCPLDIEEW